MDTIREIQKTRNRLIKKIDEEFLELIAKLEAETEEENAENDVESYDQIYPLTYDLSIFKGKKPTMLTFGTARTSVGTWKKVFEKIMADCNSNTEKHRALMELRSKISGRTRTILSDRPEGMRSPLKIDNKLYAETHYDTETLLRVLLYRILEPIKYDYKNIYVSVRNGK